MRIPTHLWKRALVLLALGLGVSPPLTAQTLSRGALDGAVRDSADAPVFDARVWLTDLSTGVTRASATTREGRFQFDFLSPGRYEVRVEQLGYRPLVLSGVPVRPGGRVELALDIQAVPGQVDSVEHRRYSASGLSGARAAVGQWITPNMLRAYPEQRWDLGEALNRTSISAGHGATEGLPGLAGVAIDGVQVRATQNPMLESPGFGAAAFPLSVFENAELIATAADVEWAGLGGGLLSAYTRRGTRDFEVRTFGSWTGDALTTALTPLAGDASYSTLHGGAIVSGPIIRDTASFVIGVETARMRSPVQQAWLSDTLVTRVTEIAAEKYGVALGNELRTGVASTEVTSLFGRFDWQLADAHGLSVQLGLAATPTAAAAGALQRPLGFGASFTGKDFFTSAALTSALGARTAQELKLSFTASRREYGGDAADNASGSAESRLPVTTFVSGGLLFGSAALMPGSFAENTAQLSETLHLTRGAHRVRVGLSAEASAYDNSYDYARSAAYAFAGPTEFASGVGSFVQTIGPSSHASFTVPRLAGFVQDSWTAAPGLNLSLGLRYDTELLPTGDLKRNDLWAIRTGILSNALKSGSGQLSPRIGFRWDVQQQGQWVIQGAGGLYRGNVDPALFAEALTHDGSLQVRRGVGEPLGWPAPAASTGAPEGGSALSVFAPGFTAPRSTRGSLGVTRQLDAGTSLYLNGSYRHTAFLPRRTDLNLPAEPMAVDQYGRPMYGELTQQGGLLVAAGTSNRRFSDFDRVSALNADGWSTYWGVTAGFQRDVNDALSAFGSYTLSRTRDNWPNPLGGPDAQLLPFARTGENARWAEGTSDFDVPHVAVAGAELRVPALLGARIAGLYRYRSGVPFTPGFRSGVDVNADGSGLNDPAFIDAGVAGMSDVMARWGCLSGANGRIVERNSCRSEGIHSLDARVALNVFRRGDYTAELYIDALNLIASGVAFPDHALYLIDGRQPLVTNAATGTVTIPLVANPNFGNPLVQNTTGRVLRLGFRLNY